MPALPVPLTPEIHTAVSVPGQTAACAEVGKMLWVGTLEDTDSLPCQTAPPEGASLWTFLSCRCIWTGRKKP